MKKRHLADSFKFDQVDKGPDRYTAGRVKSRGSYMRRGQTGVGRDSISCMGKCKDLCFLFISSVAKQRPSTPALHFPYVTETQLCIDPCVV